MTTRRNLEAGNSMLEFALVVSFLVPMLAASFTLGMTLVKGIQVGNVCRDADVLFVRALTDPKSGLDLSQSYNQAIVVRAAQGLGMKKSSTQTPDPNAPDPNGKAVVILTKILHVKDLTCSNGNPKGKAPWSTGNCPNYDSYVFASSIVIGNGTRFTSQFGAQPTGVTSMAGNYAPSDIANTTTLQIPNATAFKSLLTLQDDSYALVSEMYADIGSLNLFSIMSTPILYARNIS
jgi:hypothetical protein